MQTHIRQGWLDFRSAFCFTFHVKHKCAWTANVICGRLFLSVHCAFVGLLDVSWCRAFTWWGKLSDRIFSTNVDNYVGTVENFSLCFMWNFWICQTAFVKSCVVILWLLCFGFFCSSVFYFTKNNDLCFMWNTNHKIVVHCCFCKMIYGTKHVSYSTVSCETLCALPGAFVAFLSCRFQCLTYFQNFKFVLSLINCTRSEMRCYLANVS